MSIGFITKSDRAAKDGVREILEVELLEVSITPLPMNRESRVDSVKQHDADLSRSLDSLHRTIRSLRRSAEEAYPPYLPTDSADRLLEEMASHVRKLNSLVS